MKIYSRFNKFHIKWTPGQLIVRGNAIVYYYAKMNIFVGQYAEEGMMMVSEKLQS